MYSFEAHREPATNHDRVVESMQFTRDAARTSEPTGELVAKERAESLRGELSEKGYAIVEGLSQSEAETLLQQFGEIVPQYGGEKIWRVTRQVGSENRYDSRNQKPLYPHTECYEFAEVPPRHLALYCVKQAQCGGGHTLFTDSTEFLKTLSAEEIDQLSSRRYRFVAAEGIKADFTDAEARRPMLDLSDPEHPYFRFSYNNIRFPEDDAFMADMRERVLQFCYENNEPILVPDNALLIWDNQRMLHWRGSFEDGERLLLRYWVEAKK